MTCRKEQYRDLDKFKRTIQAQKKDITQRLHKAEALGTNGKTI